MYQSANVCPIHQQSIIIEESRLCLNCFSEKKNNRIAQLFIQEYNQIKKIKQSTDDEKIIKAIQLLDLTATYKQVIRSYINSQQQLINQKEANIPKQVILIGGMESGRTTIFNRCCKQNLKTRGAEACTKSPFQAKNVFGKCFTMIDTPGIGYLSDKINHVCGLAKALSSGKIHQIILCIRYYYSTHMIKGILFFINQKLYRFKDIITVAVTFFDLCDQERRIQFQEEFGQQIQEYHLNSILYISKEDDGEKICNQIDQIVTKVEQGRDCSLQKTELIRFFELFDAPLDDESYLDILNLSEKAISSFYTIQKATDTIIRKFQEEANQQTAEIMHCLTLSIAEIANQHLEKFEKKILKQIYQLNNFQEEIIYYFHQDLKKLLERKVKHLQMKAQRLIYEGSEYVNLIKKCPYCGLIWIKVDKCTDQTYCGEYPENDDDQIFKLSKSPRKFKFYFQNGTIQVEENAQVSQQPKNIKQLKPTIGYTGLLGCKQRFIWSELPPLERNLIEELSSGAFQDCIVKINHENDDKIEKYLSKKIDETMEKIEITKL